MRGELIVKDGRVSVPALAIGLINRIGKPKAAALANELLADIKTPAAVPVLKSRASAGAKHTLADVQPVKGAAPQKGQLPAGLVAYLKAKKRQKVVPVGRPRISRKVATA